MQKLIPSKFLALALAAASLVANPSAFAVIESNFDDQVYPGDVGGGWTGGWQHSTGTPTIQTTDPIDNASPFLRLDASGSTTRNFMRQFEAGGGLSPNAPHYIRWKFRLNDAAFNANFTVFNDRVHFFGRNAARLTASTDASINWSVMATGDAHASGASAGKTFWIFDNVEGNGAFNLANHVDTTIVLVPGDIYAFEVYVDPEQLTYTVAITNETTSASFRSLAPHRFRNLAAPGADHTFLHWGLQASSAAEARGFDLDSVTLTPTGRPSFENVNPAAYAIHTAAEGISFNVVALDPIAESNIGLRVNGADVTAQLSIGGTDLNRTASYSGLVADTTYEAILTATNASGTATLTQTFYTATSPFTLFDSEGFTNAVYAFGPLGPVVHGSGTWEPHPTEPSEITDIGDPYGQVLQRLNMGAGRSDFLHFPPVSSGTIIIEFDAWVSTTLGRTFDISLMPIGNAGTTMASMVGWGAVSNQLAYFDGAAWQPLGDLLPDWHHCKIINYLSGPAAGRYDVLINNVAVAEKVLWRNAEPGTPLSRFRYNSDAAAPIFESGRIDNLVIIAAPEDPNAFPPPLITAVNPATNNSIIRASTGLHFDVTSLLPVATGDVGVLLNGENIANALQISGTATHRTVAFANLQAETNYVAELTATNTAGSSQTVLNFIATEQAWLYDPSDGWVGPWQYTSGLPQLRTEEVLAANEPYLRYDITSAGTRNLMRQYASGAGVDLTQPHYLRWKFRLLEADFLLNFAGFNDRVHFFARNAPRLTAGTDAANSWSISATGNEQTAGSGVSAGQKFYIFDNLDGTRAYNLANLVDSGIQILPDNVYSFELLISPQAQTYSVAITNETSSAFFKSAAPHSYRAANVTPTSHTMLHFGVQSDVSTDPRSFDFGPLSITSAAPPQVTLGNPAFADNVFSFSFQSVNGVNHVTSYTGDIVSSSWTSLVTNVGDGTLITVSHTNPPVGPLFYRVSSE